MKMLVPDPDPADLGKILKEVVCRGSCPRREGGKMVLLPADLGKKWSAETTHICCCHTLVVVVGTRAGGLG